MPQEILHLVCSAGFAGFLIAALILFADNRRGRDQRARKFDRHG